jgi:hypothetical protein
MLNNLQKANEKLLIHCVAMAIRNKTSFVEFKILTEWLGCYAYVIPMYRTLDFSILSYLVDGVAQANGEARSSKVFQAWLLADIVETVLTERQQHLLYKILTSKGDTAK